MAFHPVDPGLQPHTPPVVEAEDRVVTEVAMDYMPADLDEKVKETRHAMWVAGAEVEFNFRVTFGEFGPSAEIEESKLNELVMHATTAFESTYEITKRERDALQERVNEPGLSSKQKARLRQLKDQVYALENLSTFAFTTKHGKPHLEIKAQTEDGRALNVSMELDPECSGVLTAVQSQIDKHERDLARLQSVYNQGLLTDEHPEYNLYQFLSNERRIWSDPDNYKIEIGVHPGSTTSIPYLILHRPETGEEIDRKPVETADQRLIQRVAGRTSKIQHVFQLLHARFKEAIDDRDSDFAEESGYNRYLADRTSRAPRRGGANTEDLRRMMEQVQAAPQ